MNPASRIAACLLGAALIAGAAGLPVGLHAGAASTAAAKSPTTTKAKAKVAAKTPNKPGATTKKLVPTTTRALIAAKRGNIVVRSTLPSAEGGSSGGASGVTVIAASPGGGGASAGATSGDASTGSSAAGGAAAASGSSGTSGSSGASATTGTSSGSTATATVGSTSAATEATTTPATAPAATKWKQLPAGSTAFGSTREQVAESVIRFIATTAAEHAVGPAQTCGLPSGNAKVQVLIATSGPLGGDNCMLTAGSILLVHILMFVIWDQEDPSAARTGAAKWSATISIDGIPLTDVSGGGGNVIDTGYIQTGVVAKSLFPLAPAKTHKLLGYFPAVFIEGLSKGPHELSGHYVISPGENETTFKHTITVT